VEKRDFCRAFVDSASEGDDPIAVRFILAGREQGIANKQERDLAAFLHAVEGLDSRDRTGGPPSRLPNGFESGRDLAGLDFL
jgi:hypothetical protein